MCCSMKVLSVRGTFLLPTLVCPRFRMSSRTDFKLGNLLKTFKFIKIQNLHQHKFILLEHNSHVSSPPGHVGLHHFHHGHRGLVDFDEDSTENLS